MNKSVKLTCAVLLSMLFSAGVAAKTLKFATLAPAGTTWMKEIKVGADKIKQRTEGRVKLKACIAKLESASFTVVFSTWLAWHSRIAVFR